MNVQQLMRTLMGLPPRKSVLTSVTVRFPGGKDGLTGEIDRGRLIPCR
jgi:hypothetical protein